MAPYLCIYICACLQLWRNWDDIQCGWSSLASIIEHWGTYGQFLSTVAPAGVAYNDADM